MQVPNIFIRIEISLYLQILVNLNRIKMLPFTKVTETTCVTAHISEQEKEGTQPMKTQKNNIDSHLHL
jgi:hypothetical protein